MNERDARIRLFIYESALEGAVPSPAEVGRHFHVTPQEAAAAFVRLAEDHDALVLLPGSPYIWMAEPFSAVPTDYPVVSKGRRWFGNCIWDALGIAALVGERSEIHAACPASGAPLGVTAEQNRLVSAEGVVHFAVPAHRWWESIGFT